MSCPYFRVQVEAKPLADPDRPQDARIAEIPWCGHPKHAVVDLQTARTITGGPPLLKCRGDITRCPLPPARYADL